MNERQRQKRDERPQEPTPIRITERDLDILEAVYHYRVLTAQQLQTLFFPSMHQTYARLRALYDHALLDRLFKGMYIDKMNSPIMYVIDRAGVELLQTQREMEIVWNKDFKQVSQSFLDHTLAINDVRVAVTVACCQQQNVHLLEWLSESDMKANYDYVRISLTNTTRKVSLIPDSYFVLDTPKGKTSFFLELDRGTESLPRFKEKVLAYLQYYHSGAYEKRYQNRALRILTITTSLKRAENLKTLTENAAGASRFWFTELEQINADTVLFTPIWRVAQYPKQLPLIDL